MNEKCLAEYQATGLEPDEIDKMKLTVARLRAENSRMRSKLANIERNHQAQIIRLKAKLYDAQQAECNG